ncbi:MAG: hypothetical protein LJE84_01725 [Gammaproteobacteria bacterium]|nr:hypothetical protein [Gammaproteobacteria bacterium]
MPEPLKRTLLLPGHPTQPGPVPKPPEFHAAWTGALLRASDPRSMHELVVQLISSPVLEYLQRNHRYLRGLADAWSNALLRAAFQPKQIHYSMEMLALPPLFIRMKWRITRSAEWERRRQTLEGLLHRQPQGSSGFFNALFALAVVEGLLQGTNPAALQLFERIAGVVERAPSVGGLMEKSGWYVDGHRSLPAEVLRLAGQAPGEMRVFAWLDLLGFRRIARRAWMEAVFEGLALPWMLAALEQDDFELALKLENRISLDYVRQREGDAHQQACIARWAQPMHEAGRRFGKRLGPAPDAAVTTPARIGFLLLSQERLGHSEWLLGVVAGLKAMEPISLEPVVYFFDAQPNSLPDDLTQRGCMVRHLVEADAKDSWVARLARFRETLASDGCRACVLVSTDVFLHFVFGMRIAPVQIWWSMKYFSNLIADVDALFSVGTYGETERVLDGRRWRVIPAALLEPAVEGAQEQAVQIRKRWPGKTILGSLNRPEKLDNPEFLDSLARILTENPDSVFLWFGRECSRRIDQELMRRNIRRQCAFEGWVDTRVYSRVLDVHLDSFPWPAGMTGAQVMAAGVPSVCLATPEVLQHGVLSMFWPLWTGQAGSVAMQQAVRATVSDEEGGLLLPCATSVDEYVALASQLIRDVERRRQVGAVGQRLVEKFNRPDESARVFAGHVHEVLDSVGRPAGGGA